MLNAIVLNVLFIQIASLSIVPHWHEYLMQQIGKKDQKLLFLTIHTDIGLSGEHQKLNASLALQLCRRWLIEKDRWAHISGANTSARLAHGMSKFEDGLPAPFKDGMLLIS